jgi:hypothetical protein
MGRISPEQPKVWNRGSSDEEIHPQDELAMPTTAA